MGKKTFRKKVTDTVFNIARYTEILISIIIGLVIAILIASLIYDLTNMSFFNLNDNYFTQFLSRALNLVVGIEFVKMLCKHTPETLLEVLMFATARQMVVEHLETWQTLIGVVAIGLLFAIRKYLIITISDKEKMTDTL